MPFYANGTGSSYTSATSTVFRGWVTTTSATTINTVWTSWIGTSTTASSLDYDGSVWHDVVQPEPTAEELAAQQARMATRRAVERKAMLARKRAQRRALATLLRFISAAQRDELRALGYFHVTGGASGKTYRIKRGRIANIDVLDAAGAVIRRLCAHPGMDVPDSDTMLAQALHLQSAANEELFVRTANIHPLR